MPEGLPLLPLSPHPLIGSMSSGSGGQWHGYADWHGDEWRSWGQEAWDRTLWRGGWESSSSSSSIHHDGGRATPAGGPSSYVGLSAADCCISMVWPGNIVQSFFPRGTPYSLEWLNAEAAKAGCTIKIRDRDNKAPWPLTTQFRGRVFAKALQCKWRRHVHHTVDASCFIIGHSLLPAQAHVATAELPGGIATGTWEWHIALST